MTNKPRPGGSIYRQEIQVGINANRAVQTALLALVDHYPTGIAPVLVAKAALALNQNLAALMTLERIAKNADRETEAK